MQKQTNWNEGVGIGNSYVNVELKSTNVFTKTQAPKRNARSSIFN